MRSVLSCPVLFCISFVRIRCPALPVALPVAMTCSTKLRMDFSWATCITCLCPRPLRSTRTSVEPMEHPSPVISPRSGGRHNASPSSRLPGTPSTVSVRRLRVRFPLCTCNWKVPVRPSAVSEALNPNHILFRRYGSLFRLVPPHVQRSARHHSISAPRRRCRESGLSCVNAARRPAKHQLLLGTSADHPCFLIMGFWAGGGLLAAPHRGQLQAGIGNRLLRIAGPAIFAIITSYGPRAKRGPPPSNNGGSGPEFRHPRFTSPDNATCWRIVR